MVKINKVNNNIEDLTIKANNIKIRMSTNTIFMFYNLINTFGSIKLWQENPKMFPLVGGLLVTQTIVGVDMIKTIAEDDEIKAKIKRINNMNS